MPPAYERSSRVCCRIIRQIQGIFGDVRGALALANHLTSTEERGFHRAIIVAQQAAVGDLSGAKATLLPFSPNENGRDHAIGAIANALVTAGNFEEA